MLRKYFIPLYSCVFIQLSCIEHALCLSSGPRALGGDSLSGIRGDRPLALKATGVVVISVLLESAVKPRV